MNKNEKKAVISFLFIYVGSTALFLGVMLYIYYVNELKMYNAHCSMQMSRAAQEIRADILKSYMDKKTFIPKKLKEEALSYGLFSKDKEKIYSSLSNKTSIDFEQISYVKNSFSYHITKIDEKYEEIETKYIVLETKQAFMDKRDLQVFVLFVLLFGIIFVSFIGYFLVKLLLKPVREKIKHMDDFIKDSAHELNTPVAVLLTSVSTLKKGINSEKMLKYILSSSKQISEIYNDIHFSAFNEINENVEEELDLDVLIKESVYFLSDIANAKSITISSVLSDTKIYMDRTKTRKLVNNLISNAIKYSHKDSIIEVALKEYKFCVKDYGIGISSKDQKDIFTRYKRGQNNEGGFGIGLDIVSKINYEYNLKLSLNSKLNVGSEFCIDFANIKR